MTQATGWPSAPPPIVHAVCLLCGHQDARVRHGLIRFRDGDPYGSGPRCQDVEACWDRCLANGDTWPVDDGRPRGAVKPGSDHASVLHPESMPEPSGIELLDFGTGPEDPA